MWNTDIYASLVKLDYFCDGYLSSMTNCQLRRTLSRCRCLSQWLDCARHFMSSHLDIQGGTAHLLEGRAGGEHKREHHINLKKASNVKFSPHETKPEILPSVCNSKDRDTMCIL